MQYFWNYHIVVSCKTAQSWCSITSSPQSLHYFKSRYFIIFCRNSFLPAVLLLYFCQLKNKTNLPSPNFTAVFSNHCNLINKILFTFFLVSYVGIAILSCFSPTVMSPYFTVGYRQQLPFIIVLWFVMWWYSVECSCAREMDICSLLCLFVIWWQRVGNMINIISQIFGIFELLSIRSLLSRLIFDFTTYLSIQFLRISYTKLL